MIRKPKRICVRFTSAEFDEMSTLIKLSQTWDITGFIRAAVKFYGSHLYEREQQSRDFLEGKLNGQSGKDGKSKVKKLAKGPKRHTV